MTALKWVDDKHLPGSIHSAALWSISTIALRIEVLHDCADRKKVDATDDRVP